MFHSVVLAISIAVFLYIGYLLVKAYRPQWFRNKDIEPFVQKAMGPPVASTINMAQALAPAPTITQEPPKQERVITPSGPGAPNASALPDVPAKISPEAAPIDPYDNQNMEAPIHDSMRFPELSFGPGVENKGIKNAVAGGAANAQGLTSESPFSPEFAQNGGIFMGSVSANDLSHDDTYANA